MVEIEDISVFQANDQLGSVHPNVLHVTPVKGRRPRRLRPGDPEDESLEEQADEELLPVGY